MPQNRDASARPPASRCKRNRRSIRRHDRLRAQVPLQLRVQLQLRRQGFHDRFQHQVAARHLGQIGGRTHQAAERPSATDGHRLCATRRQSRPRRGRAPSALASWITTGSRCCTWAAAMAVPIMPAPTIPTLPIFARAGRPPRLTWSCRLQAAIQRTFSIAVVEHVCRGGQGRRSPAAISILATLVVIASQGLHVA